MDACNRISPKPRWQSISFCLLTIGIALLLLAGLGCFFKSSSAQASTAVTPAANDFVVGINADIYSMDPAVVSDTNSLLVAAQVYDTLFTYQPGGSLVNPGLAVSWTISADGLTWTLDLRPGVSFQDGTPLDAAAVVFNLQRWWDPANPYHQGYFYYFLALFTGFKGDPSCLLAGVSAVGDSQVQLTLSRPYSALPSILAMPGFSIASPSAIQSGTLPLLPVGSSAFQFVERLPGDHILLEAHPEYWGTPPSLDTLSFQIIPDDAERYAALEAGTVHSVGDLPDDYATLAASDPQFQVQWRPSANVGYLGINRAHTPLDNLLVRQAIAHAVNTQALIDTLYTAGDQPGIEFVPPVIWGGNPELSAYTYDPALSISLLAQAGYTDGLTTTLSYRDVVRAYLPNPTATANAISADLQAVGIQATVIAYESSTFFEKWNNGELDLFLLGWGADYLHPDNFYSPMLCNPDLLGFGPPDTALCDLLQTALAEPDFDDQVTIYQSASQRVYDTLPLLPYVHARTNLILRYDVAGVQASPLGAEIYKDASFPGAEQIVVDPETEGSLVYYDDHSLPTILEIPAGAVSETILLRYVVTETASAPVGFGSARHTFDLAATRGGEPLPGFTFLQPVTITIFYDNSDVWGLKEETLLLFYWDGSAWLDAATTCAPPSAYTRDLGTNRLSLPICHLSIFGLFGERQIRTFLPLVIRK